MLQFATEQHDLPRGARHAVLAVLECVAALQTGAACPVAREAQPLEDDGAVEQYKTCVRAQLERGAIGALAALERRLPPVKTGAAAD